MLKNIPKVTGVSLWPFRWGASVLTLFIVSSMMTLMLMGQAQTGTPPEPWRNLPPTSTGPNVGEKIPAFQLRDQSGRMRDLNSISGPKGAAIYFIRSADW